MLGFDEDDISQRRCILIAELLMKLKKESLKFCLFCVYKSHVFLEFVTLHVLRRRRIYIDMCSKALKKMKRTQAEKRGRGKREDRVEFIKHDK